MAVVVLVSALVLPVAAQDMRASLFTEIDALLAKAKELQADVLAPKNFGEFKKLYDRAEANLQKGQQIDKIEKDVAKATEYLNTAIEATTLAEVTFGKEIDARGDALVADAPNYAADLWTAGEKKFAEAATALENGDVNAAKKRGTDAESIFREAELSAIKTNYFDETRALLAQADKDKVGKHAPKTLQRSKDLLAEAEQGLEENRYDTDGPRILARHAKYEVKHANNMAELLTRLDKKDMTTEDLVLKVEAAITKVAGALDVFPKFDEGYGLTTEAVLEELGQRSLKQRRLEADVADFERMTVDLAAQIVALEAELGGVSEERAAVVARMEAEARVREQFNQVETMFTRQEAQVYRQENNLLIRMVGLNFDVGKSTIKPEYFGLLTKAQEAINTFPGCSVIVEGHTDALGSDEINEKISKERAEAVRQYLLANMDLPESRIEAVGFGETKPIASNETDAGRTKNRRIDLVIKPNLGS